MKDPIKILIVTCDLPSHPYAAAKLAKVLGSAGHAVTLAAPKGEAYDRIQSETVADASKNITCIETGTVSTVKAFNERPVIDPHSYQTLWNAIKNPFPLADAVNSFIDTQEGMYQPLCRLIAKGNFDLVIPIHSASATVCDAIEAVTKGTTPVMTFSSLPYDPALFLGELQTWNQPRFLTTFPHVAAYSSKRPSNLFSYLLQLAWKLLDAILTARAWARSAKVNNERRARRGLPPIPEGLRGYWLRYPILSFGGVAPFFDDKSFPIDPRVTVIGALENQRKEILGDLKDWLDSAGEDGIVYAGFGTGTTLSDKEIAKLTGELVYTLMAQNNDAPRILVSLRPAEQKRLRHAMDVAMYSEATSESNSHIEYLGGRLRIQANVPQADLLLSGKVRLFISHFGMGGFVEGVQGGVPFVAYPSGCDQWTNAQLAVDSGIAVTAAHGFKGIGELVVRSLRDKELATRAKDAAKRLQDFRCNDRAIRAVEAIVSKSKHVGGSREGVSTPLNINTSQQRSYSSVPSGLLEYADKLRHCGSSYRRQHRQSSGSLLVARNFSA